MDLCFIDPYNVLRQQAAVQTCSGLTARYYPLLEHHLCKQHQPESQELFCCILQSLPPSPLVPVLELGGCWIKKQRVRH